MWKAGRGVVDRFLVPELRTWRENTNIPPARPVKTIPSGMWIQPASSANMAGRRFEVAARAVYHRHPMPWTQAVFGPDGPNNGRTIRP